MNTKLDHHISEGVLEEYALGVQSDEDCKPLEEHLLICPACQDLLAAIDEYIRVAKAAAALIRRPANPLPKPVATAVTLS
jgi:anti-sigma factor RsiW